MTMIRFFKACAEKLLQDIVHGAVHGPEASVNQQFLYLLSKTSADLDPQLMRIARLPKGKTSDSLL